jgi:hypothetical protein
MSFEDRLSKLEATAGATAQIPECQCDGGAVTVDKHGNIVCDSCGGRIPPGTKITLPPGVVPSWPSEE